MRFDKLAAVACMIALVAIVARPPEFLRLYERKAVAWLVETKRLDLARWAAWLMQLQDDAIGTTNYHALTFHQAVPSGGKVRKKASRAADRAWRAMGKRGVGAAFWNLAMFRVKYGRKRKQSDRHATGWLKWAARTGDQDALDLLAAGDGEFDRIKRLIALGDPGAMATYASSLDRTEHPEAYIVALRSAAEAGHLGSMTRLGLALFQRNESDAEILPWFERAAQSGQITAAYRLGRCYEEGGAFCGGVADLDLAEKWFRLATGPHVDFQSPRLTVDATYAIRIGTTSRWYVKPHNIRASATKALTDVRRKRKAFEATKRAAVPTRVDGNTNAVQ